MKYTLLAFSILFILFNAKAQTKAGNQSLGLNVGYGSTTTNTIFSDATYPNSTLTTVTKQTSYSVAPTYGVFVAKNLDIGVAVGVTGNLQTYDYAPNPYNPTRTRYTAYSANIQLRKYFLYQDRIGVRTGPFFLYQQSVQTNDYPAGSPYNNSIYNKVNTYSTGVTADFVYYPSRKIGLAAQLCNINYSHAKSVFSQNVIGQSDSVQNGINANFLTSNLSLSIFFCFGNK